MATPIAPRDLVILLASGMTLPLAAFLAALDLNKGTHKDVNLFGLLLGLLMIGVVVSIIFKYR